MELLCVTFSFRPLRPLVFKLSCQQFFLGHPYFVMRFALLISVRVESNGRKRSIMQVIEILMTKPET